MALTTSVVRSTKKLVEQFASACARQHTPARARSAMASLQGYQPQCVEPPAGKQVKLALCQMGVTADKANNIATARRYVQEAKSKGAQLVVLPEMWNCPYATASFPAYAEDIEAGQSASIKAMQEVADQCKVTLVAGSIPEAHGGRLYNSCCVIGPSGEVLAKHRKVHLFDIDIPGNITFRESDTLTAGESLTVVDTPVGRLGIGICYDLRFPEMALAYAYRGAQLIVYPGAFNMTTGPLHWQLLQRARAVDCQLYVATCSPARDPEASYQAWGHSTVVSPFADVIATAEHQQAIVLVDLDLNDIETRRKNMPLMQ